MLHLKHRCDSLVPVEAECVTPDALAGKSAAEAAALPVWHGNRQEKLGEFFDVTGDGADREIVVEGDLSRVKWLGARMLTGRLTIRGDAGMHLGAEMSGGEVHVHGNAGDWLGAEMSGGLIHVRGDAGDGVGSAYRGARRGMRGGALLVEGRVGGEVANTMRRGLIAVGGCGDFAAAGMIAGSLLVFGESGVRPAAGMKRGTLALLGPPAPLLPTFRYDCTYRPVFLGLYLGQLRAWGYPVPDGLGSALFRRYSGDLLTVGKGEVLLRA